MKAILLMSTALVASTQLQAQDAGTIAAQQLAAQQVQQQQQQAMQNYQIPFSSVPCKMSSRPGHPTIGQPAHSSAQFNQFAVQQMQSLTEPLQKSQSSLNGPLWNTWRVVPVKYQMAFSAKPGIVRPGTKIRIHWRGEGGGTAVYYTTDGWSPNPSSTLYRGPIKIDGPTHIQAIQLDWGYGKNGCVMRTRSVILDAYYDVASSPAPLVNPAIVTDGLLHEGTELKLVTGAAVNSNLAKPGDKVSLLLGQDITVGNTVVIPKGTPVNAVLVEAVPPQESRTGGMLIVAVRSLDAAGASISLSGVETMEGLAGRAPQNAVIEPDISFQATVMSDVTLKP